MGWTVLIVDDHPGFRDFARRLLEAGGIEVVGVADDGSAALAAVDALGPDLVLLDVLLPDMDGFDVLERLRESGQEARVMLMSSRDPEDFGARLKTSPSVGYLQKDDLTPEALRHFMVVA